MNDKAKVNLAWWECYKLGDVLTSLNIGYTDFFESNKENPNGVCWINIDNINNAGIDISRVNANKVYIYGSKIKKLDVSFTNFDEASFNHSEGVAFIDSTNKINVEKWGRGYNESSL